MISRSIVITGTIIVYSALVVLAWMPGSTDSTTQLPKDTMNLESRILTWQAQVGIGAIQFIQQRSGQSPSHNAASSTQKTFVKSLLDSYGFESTHGLMIRHPQLQRQLLVLLSYLDEQPRLKGWQPLGSLPPTDLTLQLHQALLKNTNPDAWMADPALLSALKKDLGWFYTLFAIKHLASPEEVSIQQQQLQEQCQNFFKRLLGVMILCMILALISTGLFLTGTILAVKGKLKRCYVPGGLSPLHAERIFGLYLLCLLAGSLIASVVPCSWSDEGRLLLQGFLILASSACILYPLAQGETMTAISNTYGLTWKRPRLLLKEAGLGICTYLAVLPPLFFILLAYSLLLQKMGAHPTDAAHPIVLSILEAQNPWLLLFLIFLVSGIAPFIEEIFFRGVLYSWFRSHKPWIPSLIFTSLLFAMLHPQGPLGVLVLTLIGCVLGWLREWRGNLVAAMCCHACFNGGTFLLLFLLFK